MSALGDQQDRDQISQATGDTLFVNAGAGSGKTTALVDRITTLVLRDQVPMRHVAAVTFTEKAGAELRDRLRAKFEKQWQGAVDPAEKALAAAALDDLDGAAIGTLHAFAQRLLMEHPIEAGLPPVLELLDEVGSSVAFEQRWAQLQIELLDDDSIAEPLLVGLAVGMKLTHVRSLAHVLGNDWDLLDDHVLAVEQPPLVVPDLSAFLVRVDAAVRLGDDCRDRDDKLLARIGELAALGVLLNAAGDVETRMDVLRRIGGLKFGRIGRKDRWAADIVGVRDACSAVAAEAAALVGGVLDQCLRHLTRWTALRVKEAADARRREGTLEFHDLLVLARDLLRKHADVRAALHASYQRLLLDEFQDTDPIQIELAVRIAGGAEASQASWRDVTVPGGRIFVVGDAKQSIYRFRRASIATYLDAQDHLGARAHLTTNFRTVAPILDWLNAVFGTLIVEQAAAQPEYEALQPARATTGSGPAVTVLGGAEHTDLPRAAAALLRTREAADVAGVIGAAIDEGWTVFDERTGRWRPAEPRDIAVLVPARTSLPYLEDALDTAGVPYRAEASSLVYQAREVRDLLACARAIADISDELSLVAALRSPLFGCGDDDLWRWKQAGGRFTIHADPPSADLAGSPVGAALDYLRRLSYAARWLTPSEVLGRIVAERRMLEVGALGPRARDSWRRLRFVVDQARAWSEASHGGLRAYLAWAAHQGQETTRVAEAILPETDVNAVRVMTIHAAKGLEFPIVILSGMTAQQSPARGVRFLWTEGGYAASLTSAIQTGDFSTEMPIDEQMDELEKRRLLYVAATRARDHLVVSLHRAAGSTKATAAKLLADAGAAHAGDPREFAARPSPGGVPHSPPLESAALPDHATWLGAVEAAQARARVPAAVTASGLEGTEPEVVLAELDGDLDDGARGSAKGPRDLELPPWSKGRYGSAIGRAVHGVLQVVDLRTGDGLEQAVAAQALAEGVVDQEALVLALVRSALGSDLVRRAAEREHWRETYVGTEQADGTILEGYVDLIFRDDDGTLVVVDYKTDAVPAGGLASRVAYYRPQMDAYRTCLAAATGSQVTVQLLFLHPETSTAVEV